MPPFVKQMTSEMNSIIFYNANTFEQIIKNLIPSYFRKKDKYF